jgi:hypothetical protein
LTQIPRLLNNDQIWTNNLKSLKLVFDSLKYQNADWREQESIIRQQETGQRTRPHFSRSQDMAETSGYAEPRRTEWERYVALDVASADDADLHAWWTKHQQNFPVMHSIARSYLYIPATSGGAERLFRKSRRVLSRLRLRLTAEKAEILVFLCENISVIEDLQNEGRVYW